MNLVDNHCSGWTEPWGKSSPFIWQCHPVFEVESTPLYPYPPSPHAVVLNFHVPPPSSPKGKPCSLSASKVEPTTIWRANSTLSEKTKRHDVFTCGGAPFVCTLVWIWLGGGGEGEKWCAVRIGHSGMQWAHDSLAVQGKDINYVHISLDVHCVGGGVTRVCTRALF